MTQMSDTLVHLLRSQSTGRTSVNPHNLELAFDEMASKFLNQSPELLEKITLEEAGYIHIDDKHGYDGRTKCDKPVEVKTSNITYHDATTERYKIGPLKGEVKPNRKFDGVGVFSSYRRQTFDKHFKAPDLIMIVSGFLNGKFMFMLEFPYHHDTLVGHLQNQIDRHFPEGDDPGKSANLTFNYKHFEDCEELKLTYLSDDVHDLKHFFNKNFYDILVKMQENGNINKTFPSEQDIANDEHLGPQAFTLELFEATD